MESFRIEYISENSYAIQNAKGIAVMWTIRRQDAQYIIGLLEDHSFACDLPGDGCQSVINSYGKPFLWVAGNAAQILALFEYSGLSGCHISHFMN